MLLALSRPSRSADLSQLDISKRTFKPDRVCFYPSTLAKQSRQGSQIASFFFPSLPENTLLCPVTCLKAYEHRTQSIRGKETRLLVAIIKPHRAISSSSVARWLKSLLEAAGIDISIFNAHSVRGASSSAAAVAGITTNDILKAANWSSESVFQRFYYRSSDDPSYGRAMLSSNQATNNTVDMWEWAFWNIIHKWLRLRSDCKLFGIVWRRWSRAYQRPTHPPLAVIATELQTNKKAEVWAWLWIFIFLPGGRGRAAKSCSNKKTGHTRKLAIHRWYARFHLLHTIPNNLQPLRGLSHLWIPFWKFSLTVVTWSQN